MNTLAEDYEEMADDAGRRWVARQRREHGIGPDEATCWFVDIEQNNDADTKWLGRSPGDAIAVAQSYGNNAAHRDGLGRWTLEVWGDGENTPRILRVYPRFDEQQP